MTVGIRNIVGNVPEPEELYGRTALIEHLWRQLRGNNILLLAPRRFGKTGIMRHVLKRPRDEYLPLYFDLEEVWTPQDFVWCITAEILKHEPLRALLQRAGRLPRAFQHWITDTFDEIGFEEARIKFKDSIGEDWRSLSRRLLNEMEKADATLIFIFDELPAMLQNLREHQDDDMAKEFLAWFRTARMQQQEELRRHRFIIGGSVGIDLILRRLNTPDKLNDFERLYVQPLDVDEARRLIADLCGSIGVARSAGIADRVIELIGTPVPYFIHLFCSQLAQLPATARGTLSARVLDEVYRRHVLGPSCKHYFEHYRSRLARYGTSLERAAIAMLRAAATAPSGSHWTQPSITHGCRCSFPKNFRMSDRCAIFWSARFGF